MYGAGAVLRQLRRRLAQRTGWTRRSAHRDQHVRLVELIVSILYVNLYPLILAAVLLVSTVGQLYRPAAQTLIHRAHPPKQLVMVTAMQRLSLNLATTVTPFDRRGAAVGLLQPAVLGRAAAAVVYGLIALLALPRPPQRAEPQAGAEAEAAVQPPAPGTWPSCPTGGTTSSSPRCSSSRSSTPSTRPRSRWRS